MAALAGLHLDPWQRHVLVHSLGERPDGKWSAFEVGLVVARQNGKGSILEARELAGLFLLGEALIIHSAHQFDTSLEAFRRLLSLIEDTPELDSRVQRVSKAHGEEGIELKNRQRIRFRTRTSGGGRGFSCDCLILDEAMILPVAAHGALLPTLAARMDKSRSGPQVWYTGSAVDQQIHEHGVVLARVRDRGSTGGDPALAYFEFSADADLDELVTDRDLAQDRRLWAEANPALGIRITADYVANEQRSMAARTFAVERLSVGDWPVTSESTDRVIDLAAWRRCADTESRSDALPVFALDVTPKRTKGAIASCRIRPDGLPHVGIVESGTGTGWLVRRCEQLRAEFPDSRFVVDPKGPAASLLAALGEVGIIPVQPTPQEYARACSAFFDAVTEARVRYCPPQPELDVAVDGVGVRPLGDSWAWSRRSSAVDISPLVATTLALWLAVTAEPAAPQVWDLNEMVAEMRATRAGPQPADERPDGSRFVAF